jgi:hypothetical protein
MKRSRFYFSTQDQKARYSGNGYPGYRDFLLLELFIRHGEG